MALTPSTMVTLGTKAPDFDLPDVMTGHRVHLEGTKKEKGVVVMFICCHCPYVIHIQEELVRVASEYGKKEVGFVAVSSNDVLRYPEDAPERLKEQALSLGFDFPYLYDETQKVARAYDAACTPDFFVFEQGMTCVYRGRFDAATPGNQKPVNGKDLREALDALVAGRPVPSVQLPSIGCSIKWK